MLPRQPLTVRGGLTQLSDEVSGIGRDIDRILLQGFQRYDVKGPLVGGGKNYRCGSTVKVGLHPAAGDDTPTVSRLQAEETVLRPRCRQVVPHPLLMSEEVSGDDGAYGVAAHVLWPGVATAVTVEPGHRVRATLLQPAADDIAR